MRLRRGLRLVEHDEQQVARLIGRQHRGERGEHLGLGIAAAHHLVRGAGLAADVIALHVGFGRSPLLHIEPHEITHFLAGLGLDDLPRERRRFLLAAFEESGRNEPAAIHQRTDRRHRLQRRNRQAVSERDRHGVELAPAPRNQRLRALRQFGAQPLQLAHFAQERLVVLDAEAERHARGADVRRIRENLRHRQHAVLRVEIVDRELAVLQRMAGVE